MSTYEELNQNLEDDEFEPDDTSSISDISKAVLGVTAVSLNPIGAGIAYAISKTAGFKDQPLDNLVDCPNCNASLELSDDELLTRRFICPECQEDIRLDAYAVCPKCETELDLNEEEQARGWYICPECHWAIHC